MPAISKFEIRGAKGNELTKADANVLSTWLKDDVRIWAGSAVIEVPKMNPDKTGEDPIRSLQILCEILGLEAAIV
jgi:hypothetical protein